MTKEAHEAYASGAASALQGMNIPEEVKLAAFQYMTKEAGIPPGQAVQGLSTLAKSLLGLGAVGGVGTAAIAADRAGLGSAFNDNYADAYQARYGAGYEDRLNNVRRERKLKALEQSGDRDVENIVYESRKRDMYRKKQRAQDLRRGREARAGGNLEISNDMLRNLGYGAATVGGLYGLHRLMS